MSMIFAAALALATNQVAYVETHQVTVTTDNEYIVGSNCAPVRTEFTSQANQDGTVYGVFVSDCATITVTPRIGLPPVDFQSTDYIVMLAPLWVYPDCRMDKISRLVMSSTPKQKVLTTHFEVSCKGV